MTPSKIGVYQCANCGSVVEQELQRLPPFCCGCEMSKTSELLTRHGELLIPASADQRWVKFVGHQTAEQNPPPRTQFHVHGI